MTFPRDLIAKAFPGQPRMQAAFEGLVSDAEDMLSRLEEAASALASLQGVSTSITDILSGKQDRYAILTAIGLLGPDPGVIEQLGAGIVSIRPVDAEDTKSLLTRELADTRYLGAAHAAPGVTDGDKGDIVVASGVWNFDSSVVTTFARTFLDDANAAAVRSTLGLASIASSGSASDLTTGTVAAARMPAFSGDVSSSAGSTSLTLATVNANTGTYGGAQTSAQISVDGKGRITGVSAITITPLWSNVLSTPTTLAGYGITNAQTLNANLTAISGLATAADKLIYWTGSGTAALLSFPSAARSALTALSGTNTGDQTITLTGDATGFGTGSFAVVVGKINGVSLAGLATGILKNTTGTGVPSIAVAADFPTLNQNTTGSAATLTTSRNFSIGGGGITAAAVGFNGSAAVVLSASVDAGHITLARMADVATGTVFYRKSAGTGAPEVQTLATLKTDLAFGTAANQNTGTSGANVPLLNGANTWSGQQNLTAGLKESGTVVTRFENTGAAAPTGAAGAGFELCGNVGSTGLSRITAYNRTSNAYIPLQFDCLQFQFRIGGAAGMTLDSTFNNYANDAAAAIGGVPVNGWYRSGSVLMVRVA